MQANTYLCVLYNVSVYSTSLCMNKSTTPSTLYPPGYTAAMPSTVLGAHRLTAK